MIKKMIKGYSIDLFALFISIIALYFTIWQSNEQIKHNHVSVEPRLTSYFASDTKLEKYGIYIINNGMGTAFVKELKVFVDGHEVPDHTWGKFFSAAMLLELNPLCFVIGGPRPNDSFGVGNLQYLIEGKFDPVVLPYEECHNDRQALQEAQKNRLDYKMIIESIYGDTFEYHYRSNTQRDLSDD